MSNKRIPAVLIGLRYILAKRDNRFISFTSLLSMAGLTLGVLALIVVLSVFNGNQGWMRDRTLLTVPHADLHGSPSFPQWEAAANVLQQDPRVAAVAPYTLSEALLSEKGYHQVTQVRGILPALESGVTPLADSMLAGALDNLQPGQQGIVLGRGLADNLRLYMGDAVNLIVPRSNAAGTSVSMELHRFTVVGIFDVGFSIGSDLALIHIEDSQRLFGTAALADKVHLRLKTTDIYQAGQVVQDSLALLRSRFPGPDYQGEDWTVSEASLFNALRMEKLMTWFMLMMIVTIGAFNIVSTLVMVVAEKQADIAILRTMGANERTILGIFIVQGSVIGIAGIALGAVCGVLLALNFPAITGWLEQILNSKDLYVVSALPAELHWQDVGITCAVALLISFLATLYPAWKASKIMPAQVLRYE